jgi:hypothetical protein
MMTVRQGTLASVSEMTAGQRAQFERDGYLVIRGALSPDEVDFCTDALDQVHARTSYPDSMGHYPDQLPLHADLKSRRLLDPANPALRP